jgi:hypothetical protein
MEQNMGEADRWIRITIAAIIIGLFAGNIISGTVGYLLLALAGIFVLTSFVSFCPLYVPFGISTRKKDQ